MDRAKFEENMLRIFFEYLVHGEKEALGGPHA
jgi:hypothetical protein